MNIAISDKGSEVIKFVYLDATITRSGKKATIVGSNGRRVFTEALVDVTFTLDAPLPVSPVGPKVADLDSVPDPISYKVGKSDLSKPPLFMDQPAGSKSEVNAIVREEIRKKYSIEDELKLNRLKAGGLSFIGWSDYNQLVDKLVVDSNEFVLKNKFT